MTARPTYEQLKKDFDWPRAAAELGLEPGAPLNIGWFCSDRICDLGKQDKDALRWEDFRGESRTYTFDDVRVLSNTFATFLQDQGVTAGDRVCMFLDRVPELYIGFLGVLKMGAIVQPLFSAFGDDSLWTRLDDASTRAIVTQKKHLGKVRRARENLPGLEFVFVVDEANLREGEIRLDLAGLPRVEEYTCHPTTAETPSVLHYTSGTTGQPKGAQHVHNSLVSQYITAKWVLDLKEDDVYWCNADPGWVTGTSYGIIGPWSNGVTQAILDAGFNAEKWYAFIERQGITVWYSAPTAIRLLMKEGLDLVRRFDLSCLRHLASVGEPLNAEAVLWGREAFGLDFHDTYWQTETGCMVITNFPGMEVRPGSMGKPFPGITAAVLDTRTFEPLTQPGQVGLIAIREGWPSQIRGYWNNLEGYRKKIVNGWYICGDRASIDRDGYYWFCGRDDDVINTGGHLVGPFEIESALLEHPAVAESAAVAKPDPVNMEVVKAFVTLKAGFEPSKDLELEIMNVIRKKLSGLAMPQEIEFIAALPKTRSGKIVRRILRAQEFGEPIGDVSSLMND
ncbi:acetate--CoA ligase [bacterium]|nr:acetate--CoA ligase [bacterium]